jgi:hypothetical protein
MTDQLTMIRQFRGEVAEPAEDAWTIARDALERAIEAERTQHRVRHGGRRVRKHRHLIAIALLVAALSAGIAAAAIVLPDLTAPAPGGPATASPRELVEAFAVLRRARHGADALPQAGASALTTQGSFGPHYGVNPRLSRLLITPDGQKLWLVPGRDGSCIYGPDGGSACAANASIVLEGLMLALVPVDGAAPTITGIAPDNATVTTTDKDGSSHLIPLHGNAYTVSGDPHLARFTIRDIDGREFASQAPGPPPAKLASPTSSR